MKLTDKIKYKLISWCKGNPSEIIIPNFYDGPYEMDVFRLMKSGYVIEYEIKISKQDFKKDFTKAHSTGWGTRKRTTFKHEELIGGRRMCNRFFFVVPEGLITMNDIPNHAGLIYFNGSTLYVVKNAPLLHRIKITDKKDIYMSLAHRLSGREEIAREKAAYWKYKYDETLLELIKLRK